MAEKMSDELNKQVTEAAVMESLAENRIVQKFYEQHPDETLIVVTADHETGGMALGNNQPLRLERLAYQQCSSDTLSARLTALCQQYADQLTWKQVKAFLAENTGLFDELSVSAEEEAALQTAYENMMRQQESLKPELFSLQIFLSAL